MPICAKDSEAPQEKKHVRTTGQLGEEQPFFVTIGREIESAFPP